jgi:amino acid adenylation domain-containing protein
VVARWTGQPQAVFGSTRAGRHIVPGTTGTVGCLINTLPVRVPISPSVPTDTLLGDLRAGNLALRTHEHAALTDIRRWAGVPGTVPLFQSMVMYDHASLTQTLRRTGPDWAHRRVELLEEGALPLTVAAYGDRELLLVLEHDPGMVDASRARSMLTHLTEALAALATSRTNTPLSHLTMLPRSEEGALLALGRPDLRLPARAPCVAQAFADRAAAQPQAGALVCATSGQTLDFAGLEALVAAMTAALVQAAAAPGQIVAICLPRSPDFIVAMLAVLRTGAAFLPLDPTYPDAVLNQMLIDSGAALVVALPGYTALEGVTCLHPVTQPSARRPVALPSPDPDRLAYVIYTSGSTGVPKGVRVPMRALAAHGQAISAAFGLTPSDRVLQFASLSFDVSIEEVIPTLSSGATLVLRDADMGLSVSRFLDQVAHHGITVLNLPTAFWHVLVDVMAQSGRALPPHVRLVVVGGEQISPRALATWQRIAPGVRWLNGYGPTETTITCTLHEPGPLVPGDDIPIGRPTAHARAYVLAPDGSLAPPGAVGALWIGGEAVSDGYIGHAEQTAAAFVPDRFHGTGRIYNTGDRARWRPDGTLAFLGRQDRQVKLRGFRIDLRHVERVLERAPDVGRALAQVLQPGTPGARLVAWVAGAKGQSLPDTGALRRTVASQLPPHMQPTLVAVQDFARTPGGKIDVGSLPLPNLPAAAPILTEVADDPVSHQIAALMARTLGLPHLALDDDFHDLGGHSLLAVQLIGRIEAELGHRLGVADLHRCPTPRALAAILSAAQAGPRYILPIQPQGSHPPLFGVHVLGRNEEHFRPLAAELGPDQPVYGLTVGLLAQDTPIGVQETARAYAADITRYFPTGPISLGAVSLASYVAYDLAQQLILAGRDVRVIAMFDSAGPGGRSRLSGRARIGVHLRQLRKRGPRHLAHIVTNRWADLVYRARKLRLLLRLRNRRGDAPQMTVETFMVAAELAVAAYDVRPIRCPLTIFRADENVFDSPESARDGLGWASVAAAGFEVIDVPGDHLSILQPPNVGALAQHLKRLLDDPAVG